MSRWQGAWSLSWSSHRSWLRAPVAAAAVSPGGVPASGAWAELARRPLKLPRLASGKSCPQSKLRQPDPQRFGIGLGDGPLYAIAGQGVRSSPTTGNKVLWVADPASAGPIRIRGGQLDGDGEVLLGGPLHNYWSGQPVKRVAQPTSIRSWTSSRRAPQPESHGAHGRLTHTSRRRVATRGRLTASASPR
jgi:hypothetical protein